MCDKDHVTFLYSANFSADASAPYNYANPTQWGIRNTNWRDFGGLWCLEKNCTGGACGPPVGCFPGTPDLAFKDALHPCSASSGNPGLCGTSEQACKAGVTFPMLVCSGKGILQLREGRDEYYCACGDPASILNSNISAVHEVTQLTPNGFGGDSCSNYACPIQNQLYFSSINPLTNSPYLNSHGQTLPGLWLGACGAPIGPDPLQISVWNQCCPPPMQLEFCPYTPCELAGSTQCLLSPLCIQQGGTPLVYPCNNHGIARVDGTCLCDEDQTTGKGWTYDLTKFSTLGCFLANNCQLSRVAPYKPCNWKDPADTSTWTVLVKVGYIEQQYLTSVFNDGLPPTNESFIRAILPQIEYQQAVQLQALQEAANFVHNELLGFNSCVCVYPNNSLQYMVQNLSASDLASVLPYNKSFTSPYLVFPTNTTWMGSSAPYLIDNKFYYSTNELVIGRDMAVLNATSPITVNLPYPLHLSTIRIHAVSSTSMQVNISTPDGASCAMFPYVAPSANVGNLTWIGKANDGALYCSNTYQDFDFTTWMYKGAYFANCLIPTSAGCRLWQTHTCLALGWLVPNSLDYVPGCNFRVCCVPITFGPQGFYTSFTIYGMGPTVAPETTYQMYIDEIEVLGYGSEVIQIPIGLQQEISIYTHFNGCVDEKFFLALTGTSTLFAITDQTYFYPNQTLGFANMTEVCALYGGWPATPIASPDAISLNQMFLQSNTHCTSTAPCWVAAKNRETPPFPVLSDYFAPNCTNYGCFLSQPGNWTDLYSAPEDGEQWTVPQGDQYQDWPSVVGAYGAIATGGGGGGGSPTDYTYYTRDNVLDEGCTVYLYFWPNCGAPDQSQYCDQSPPTCAGTCCSYNNDANQMLQIRWTPQNGYQGLYVQGNDQSPYVQPGITAANNGPGIYDPNKYAPGWQNYSTTYGGGFQLGSSSPIDVTQLSMGCNIPNVPYDVGTQGLCSGGACNCYAGKFTSGGGEYEQELTAFPVTLGSQTVSIGVTGSNCHVTVTPFSGSTYVLSSIPSIVPRISPGDFGYTVPDTCYNLVNAKDLKGITVDIIDPVLEVEFSPRAIPTFTDSSVYPWSSTLYSSTTSDEFVMGYDTYPFMCLNLDFKVLRTINPGGTIDNTQHLITSPTQPVRWLYNYVYDYFNSCNDAENAHCTCEYGKFLSCPNSKFLTPGCSTIPPGCNCFDSEPNPLLPAVAGKCPYPVMTANDITNLATRTHFFENCTARTQNIQDCTTCFNQNSAFYEWDPKVLPTTTNYFPNAVDLISNKNNGATKSSVYITWTAAGIRYLWYSYADMQTHFPAAYARFSCNLNMTVFRSKWALDDCVVLVPSTDGSTGILLTSVCEQTYAQVCLRDLVRYEVVSGRLCDLCGCDARDSSLLPANPAATCIELFPLANATANPWYWGVYESSLTGTLLSLVVESNQNW